MGIILLIPIFMFAKGLHHGIKTPVISLATQLANDQDFQAFNSEMFVFVTKLKTTSSFELFRKVAKKTATEADKTLFLAKMELNSMDEFYAFFKQVNIYGKNVVQKFPGVQGKDNKVLILDALQIMNKENKLLVKMPPPNGCWAGYTAGLLTCAVAFGIGSDNYFLCTDAALLDYFTCQLVDG